MSILPQPPKTSAILGGGYSPWQAPLAALFQGLSAAGQPGGWANFGPAVTQANQNFQAQQMDNARFNLVQEQAAREQQRFDNEQRAAEEERARAAAFRQKVAALLRGQATPTPPARFPGDPQGAAVPPGQSAILGGMDPKQAALFQVWAEASPEQAFQFALERQFAEPDAPEPPKTVGGMMWDGQQYVPIPGYTEQAQAIAEAGSSTSTVNINTPKSILKGDEKLLEIGAEGMAQGQEIMPLFDIAKSAAENFSQSGPLGGAALFTERAKNYLGLPNNAGAGEVLQGMQTRLGTLLRVPGSGATSNMEMSLYMQGVPSLLNSQQGNVALATIGKKLVQRRIADFQKLQAYVEKNGTSVGYMPDETPVLTSQEMQMLMGGASTPPPVMTKGPQGAATRPGNAPIVRDGYTITPVP